MSHALAGRREIVELWPLSRGEIGGRREGFIDRLFERRASFAQGVVLHTGEHVLPFRPDRWALPLPALWPDGGRPVSRGV